MALTQLYGHQMALSWDLGAQGLTSQQLRYGRDVPGGYPIDLSQNDDVFQAMGAITKIDNPVRLRERIDRGDLVVNYGLQLVYRNQGNDVLVDPQQQPAAGAGTTTEPPNREQLPKKLQAINAIVFTPDVWFKLYFKALTIEFEGIGVFGKVDHPGPLAVDDTQMTLRQLGWVMASELRLYRESLFIGFETGGATGDQAEDPCQYLNYRWKFVQQPHGRPSASTTSSSRPTTTSTRSCSATSWARSPTPSTSNRRSPTGSTSRTRVSSGSTAASSTAWRRSPSPRPATR